jgi:hypothetical protein
MPTYPDLSEQLRETLAAHAARAGSVANTLRGWIRAAHRDVPRRRAALSRPAVEPLYTRGMHRYEREAAVAAWRARCTVRASDREQWPTVEASKAERAARRASRSIRAAQRKEQSK